MCGKCGAIQGKVACAGSGLGTLSLLLAIISRLTHFAPMTLGPRSFAAASALFYLMSIALHTCKSCCSTEEHTH